MANESLETSTSLTQLAECSSAENENDTAETVKQGVRKRGGKGPNRRSKKAKRSLYVVPTEAAAENVPGTNNAISVKGLVMTETGDEEYEVEEILDYKYEEGIESYLVKWKGWGAEYNSYVPKGDLHCPELLREFLKKNAAIAGIKIQGPGVRTYLENFLKEYKPKEENVESLLESNVGTLDTLLAGMLTRPNLENLINNAYAAHLKCQELEQKIRDQLVLREIKKRKEEHQSRLQQWEKTINAIATICRPPLKVENNVDLEDPPMGFVYSETCKAGEGVILPDDPIVGCECFDCKGDKQCCGPMSGSLSAYNIWGRVKVPVGVPIYECNKRCKCGPDCNNRVVQKGSKYKLCIFRTADGRGWGIKTLENIKKDSFVTEYVGEVITSEEAERRGEKYDAEGRTYLFDLDYNDSETCPYTVDAAFYGNAAHFINHSCDPNLVVYGVWVNCLDPNMPKLALFAKRDIKRGEEITFDYMSEAFKATPGHALKDDTGSPSREETVVADDCRNETPPVLNSAGLIGRKNTNASDKMECKCGSENCRKFIFS